MKLRTLFAIALSVSFALPLPALSADAPLANVSYKRVPAFLNGEDVEGAWNLKAGDTVSTGNGVAYVLARYIDSTSLGVLAQSKVAFHKGWVDVAAGGVTVDLVAGTRHIRQLDFPMGVALLDATTGSVELKPAISDTNGVETRDLKFSVDAGRAEFQLTQLGGAATPLVSIVADAADRATCTFPTGSVSLSLASDRGELTVRLGDVAQLAIPQSARAVLAYDARKQAFRIESTRGEIAVAQGDKSTPVLMGASLEIPVALDSGKDHIVARGVPAPPPPVFDTTAAVPTSVATATPPPKPVIIWAPPAITKLPQDYDYQKTLRAYIGSLTEAEVAAGTEYPKVMPPGDDLEEMYRNYMLIFDTVPMVGRKRALSSITAPGKLFLLPAIETPEGVCRPHAWPEPLAWLTEWDYPGNPYRGSATMKRRAFVTAAVLLMLLDYTQEHDPEFGGCRVDGVALHLIQFGYTFQKVRSAVPQVAQQAFLAGLKRIVDRAFAWGPEGDTVGMDVAAAVGLHLCAEAINDPEIRLRSEAYTKRMVSDPEFFHPAGYWVTYGGYDGAYNGTARYYAVWLALLTGNKDVEAALAKAYRLRGHLALPEPDGEVTGPAHFNPLLSRDPWMDQFEWRYRDYGGAMITDEAAHLAKLPTPEELQVSGQRRVQELSAQIKENAGELPVDKLGNAVWKYRPQPNSWSFPATINFAQDSYRAGSYARRAKLEAEQSPLTKVPFARDENFLRAFENVFTITKQPSYGAIVHTGPVGAHKPGGRFYPGPYGFGGGQLSAFWTAETGAVVLSRRGGTSGEVNFDLVENWRQWPIHAVTGTRPFGSVFTTALIREPDVVQQINGLEGTIRVRGLIPQQGLDRSKVLEGRVEYERTFTVTGNATTVETKLTAPDRQDKFEELVETIPVYLRDLQRQRKTAPTMIEFQIAGRWQPAEAEYQRGVTAVRLSRFGGKVRITFDRPRRVKLSPEDWFDSYLSRASCRNVMIDLLESDDRAAMFREASVRYSIAVEPSNPAVQ